MMGAGHAGALGVPPPSHGIDPASAEWTNPDRGSVPTPTRCKEQGLNSDACMEYIASLMKSTKGFQRWLAIQFDVGAGGECTTGGLRKGERRDEKAIENWVHKEFAKRGFRTGGVSFLQSYRWYVSHFARFRRLYWCERFWKCQDDSWVGWDCGANASGYQNWYTNAIKDWLGMEIDLWLGDSTARQARAYRTTYAEEAGGMEPYIPTPSPEVGVIDIPGPSPRGAPAPGWQRIDGELVYTGVGVDAPAGEDATAGGGGALLALAAAALLAASF